MQTVSTSSFACRASELDLVFQCDSPLAARAMNTWRMKKEEAKRLYCACKHWEHLACQLGRVAQDDEKRSMPNCACDFDFANLAEDKEELVVPAYDGGAFLFLMQAYQDQDLVRKLAHVAYFGCLTGVPEDSHIWHQPLHLPHNGPGIDDDKKEEEEDAFVAQEMTRRLRSGSVRKAAPIESIFVSLSPLRIKRREGSKDRLVHDLSYPHNNTEATGRAEVAKSINSLVSSEMLPLVNFTFDNFLDDVRACGPGCFIWKTDIQDAYRHIRLAPGQEKLFGFNWRGQTYVDCSLPFGYRLSPALFNMLLPEPCEWILRRWQVDVRHYLDDFFGCSSSLDKAEGDYQLARKLLQLIGLTIHPSGTAGKDVAPATRVEILGIEIDTVAFTLSLSKAKLKVALNAIRLALGRATSHLEQLQSLAGLLSAATRVLPLGRPFLLEMYALMDEPGGTDVRRHSPQMCSDLLWWLNNLPRRNGALQIAPAAIFAEQIWTDASGQEGIGAHIGRQQAHPRDTLVSAHGAEVVGCNIFCKEMWALLQALRRWQAAEWRGHRIVCWTDNEGLKEAVSSWRTSAKHAGMMLRQIADLCLVGGFTLKAAWIPTELNTLADRLSRFKDVGPESLKDDTLRKHTILRVRAVRAQHCKVSREPTVDAASCPSLSSPPSRKCAKRAASAFAPRATPSVASRLDSDPRGFFPDTTCLA